MSSLFTLENHNDVEYADNPDAHVITTDIQDFCYAYEELVGLWGDFEEALKLFRGVSEANPNNTILHLDISHALREHGEDVHAARYYDKYINIQRRNRIRAVMREYMEG